MLGYGERLYRILCKGAFSFKVSYKESDIFLLSDRDWDRKEVEDKIKKYYGQISEYIKFNPQFFSSLSPIEEDATAPPIVQDMISAARKSGIGPFSSVAGAIAWYVGKDLISENNGELILENGGDLFLRIENDKRIGVYIPNSYFDNLVVKIKKRNTPFGIASSSAKFGHSLNFGCADLVTVIAEDSILADTFATAFSNRIKKEEDIQNVVKEIKKYPFIQALIIVFGEKLILWGDIELDV